MQAENSAGIPQPPADVHTPREGDTIEQLKERLALYNTEIATNLSTSSNEEDIASIVHIGHSLRLNIHGAETDSVVASYARQDGCLHVNLSAEKKPRWANIEFHVPSRLFSEARGLILTLEGSASNVTSARPRLRLFSRARSDGPLDLVANRTFVMMEEPGTYCETILFPDIDLAVDYADFIIPMDQKNFEIVLHKISVGVVL